MSEQDENTQKENDKNIHINTQLNNSLFIIKQLHSENPNNISKRRLRSKTLFAYRDDDSYFQFCDSDDQTDSYYIPDNNLNNSNFFSTICDKSHWSRFNHEMNMRPINGDHDKVNLELDDSIASEILKSLGLDDPDDNLNDAKLSLYNNDISLTNDCISQNTSTPIHFNSVRIIDIDENKQTLSSSSSLINQFCPTSNTSSFTDEKKNISNKKLNCNKYYQDPEKINNHNLNRNNFDFHANSVDFTNIPPKLNHTVTNGYTKNLPPNIYPVQNTNRNFLPYTVPKNNPNYYMPFSFNSEQVTNYPIYYENFNLNNFRPLNNDMVLVENIFLYVRDQNGCRILQKKIEEKNKEFLFKFYEKIQNNMIDIINDQFGNYVFQKFIECCDKSYITKVIEKIKGSMLIIAINTHGTRVLQKILDLVYNENDLELLKEFFIKNFYNLFNDNNGNHVIQKVLCSFPKQKNHLIIDEVIKFCVEISRLKLGGCIIQKALDNSSENQKKTLIFEIIKNIDKLINDEFGNFIIQHIIFMKVDEYNERIFNFLYNNLVGLSKLKYSSNVIDKCILFEESKYRNMFITKLISSKAIPELIIDQYGNYGISIFKKVIQKALSVSDTLQFMEIISMIKPAIKNLKQNHFGKKIYDNLVYNYGEYFQNQTNKNGSFTKKSEK